MANKKTLKGRRAWKNRREHIFNKCDGKCYICAVELGDSWTIDHFMPTSAGGAKKVLITSSQRANHATNGRA